MSKKDVWRKTSFYDSNLRSFIAKLITSQLPVRKRQCAWYPEVYHRHTDVRCSQCKEEEESVGHSLECSNRKTGSDFKLKLREKLESLSRKDSEFGLESKIADAIVDLPFADRAHKGMPHSWHTSVDRVHKACRRTGLKPPPRNTWMAAVLHAGLQALYDTCWNARNDAVFDEEGQHGNPAHNHRLMRLPRRSRRAVTSRRGAARNDDIPPPPPKPTSQQTQ